MRLDKLAAFSAACAFWMSSGDGGASAKAADAAQALDPSNTAHVEFINMGAGHKYRETKFHSFLICAATECTQARARAHFVSTFQHNSKSDIPAGVTVVRGRAITMNHRFGGWVEQSCSFSIAFRADPLQTYQIGISDDEATPTCGVSVTDKSNGKLVMTDPAPWVDDSSV